MFKLRKTLRSWFYRGVQLFFEKIKGLPTLKKFIQDKWWAIVLAFSAHVFAYLQIFGVKEDNDWKAWAKLGALYICVPLGYEALRLLKHFLEKRPDFEERTERLKKLGDAIFKEHVNGVPVLGKMHFRPNREMQTASTEELVRQMTLLNCKLFVQSTHGQKFQAKLSRNELHMDKNPRVIWLLGMKPAGREQLYALSSKEKEMMEEEDRLEWVGFSHILPLTKRTYKKYTRDDGKAGIPDVDFSDELVCGEQDKVYAFLIFTVAVDSALIKTWEYGSDRYRKARLWNIFARNGAVTRHIQAAERMLFRMAFKQIRTLVEHHACEDQCRILAQAYSGRAAKSLAAFGFTPLGKKTADNEELYEKIVRVH